MDKIQAISTQEGHMNVLINDILHLRVKKALFAGLQSFITDKASKRGQDVSITRWYCVEIYQTVGDPILLEYAKKEMWEAILYQLTIHLL